ncbi:restriction endonuclease [uncultured Roseovarius sp.]|uniref:restriction endonuclease n=1 Tax=uncultured Roseovarius sp. TaxID=293344 RepID=UPI00260AE474|nr:restriction endonuclease [uncultured Roseovarius sp.]
MMARNFTIEESGFPDAPGMMLATIMALKELGGSASIAELDEKVVEIEEVSEHEQSFEMVNNPGTPRLNYYLAWARTYLKRGGALENSSRGVWALTLIGSSIESYSQTQKIYEQVVEEEKERARLKRLAKSNKSEPNAGVQAIDVSGDTTADSVNEAEVDWEDKLLSVLRKMDPSAFERLAQRLLRESGFTKVEVRGKSGDGGIDGVGVLRVNLVSFQVYFQCKRYTGGVSAGEIRDFRGAMQGRADKGLFITTGHYTAQANEEATRDGATAIDLIDGRRLCELLKVNGLGVSTEMVESVKIDPDWFSTV